MVFACKLEQMCKDAEVVSSNGSNLVIQKLSEHVPNHGDVKM